VENPNGLVSLLKMIEVLAADLTASLIWAQTFATTIGIRPDYRGGVVGDEKYFGSMAGGFETLAAHLRKLDLVRQAKSAEELAEYMRTKLRHPEESSVQQLLGLIVHDLEGVHFLPLPVSKAAYYKPQKPLFGEKVSEQFPGCQYDISEAGACYALGRTTGCVFHLMRVLEIGLQVFAARFNVPADHTNWHNIIEGIEKAIRNMGSDPNRPSDWKDQQEFFSQAASSFMVMKDAWRNYTAHARGKYTEDEAEALFRTVRSFMQRLGTRLHE